MAEFGRYGANSGLASAAMKTLAEANALRADLREVAAERDNARAQLTGILVALGVELPVPVDKALEVALDRIEELFGREAVASNQEQKP